MALVRSRRRVRGLGDLSTDMHNAAMAATTVSDLPGHGVPYLTAYKYAGQTFINMNNPAESGDDTSNWVSYTDTFFGVTEQQKTFYWGGQGAEVAIPGWTPEMAVKDPQGYQAALALWRQQNAGQIAAITTQIQSGQAAEKAATNQANLTADAQDVINRWLATPAGATTNMPPDWFYDYTALNGDLKREIQRLVARMPAKPPTVQPMTSQPVNPTPTTTTTSTPGGQSLPTYTPPGWGGSGGGYIPVQTGGPSFDNSNPDSSMGGGAVPAGASGPGFDASGGGGGAVVGGLWSPGLLVAAAAAIGVAVLFKRKR